MQKHMARQQTRLGYLYVSLAAILFAMSGTSAKSLFNDGITAFQLIQMRTTLAFGGLLAWLCLKKFFSLDKNWK